MSAPRCSCDTYNSAGYKNICSIAGELNITLRQLRAENKALKQQVEQGKRDAERLDYLQQGVTIDLWGKELLFRVGGLYATLNKSIREAIDAAIAAAPKQEK